MSILKSLLITSIISLFFSFGLRNTVGFWETFAIATGLQIIFAFLYNSYRISKQQDVSSLFQAEIEEILSYSDATFVCPCGNHSFNEKLFINTDNTFKCKQCKSLVRADIKIEPILLTESISEPKTYEALKTISEKEL